MTMISARTSLKWAYCIVLAFSAAMPFVFRLSSWGVMVQSGAVFVALAVPFIFGALTLYRIYLVARVPSALESYPNTGFAVVLRSLGIGALYVGAIIAVAATLSFAGPKLMQALMKSHTESGAEYFVAGLYSVALSALSVIGTVGLVMFEFSRLLGFERNARAES
jgi:hypothetical protein